MWSVRFFHSCQLTHCVICSQRYISLEIDEIHKFIKRRALENTVYAWFVQLYQTLVFNLFSIFGLIKMATQKFYVEILLIRIRPCPSPKWPHSKSWFGEFEFEPGLGVRSTWAPPPSSAWPSSQAAGWPGRRGARRPPHPPAKMLEMIKTWNLSWTHDVSLTWSLGGPLGVELDITRWLQIATSRKI